MISLSILEYSLIPNGIALFWYNVTNALYNVEPSGAQNLLPCKVELLSGTNDFDVLHLICSKDILLTVEPANRCHA